MKIARTTRAMLAATALVGTLGVGFVAGHAAPPAPSVMTVSTSDDAPSQPKKLTTPPPADEKHYTDATKVPGTFDRDAPQVTYLPSVSDLNGTGAKPVSAPETPAKAQGGTSTPETAPKAPSAPAPADDSCK